MQMPVKEIMRCESVVAGQAERFGLSSEDYLRKVWYHEQAARIGEYLAMVLLDQVLSMLPTHREAASEAIS